MFSGFALGFHTCVGGILTTEPSPQPQEGLILNEGKGTMLNLANLESILLSTAYPELSINWEVEVDPGSGNLKFPQAIQVGWGPLTRRMQNYV